MDIIVNDKMYTASDYEEIIERIEELMAAGPQNADDLFELIELSEIADKYEEINHPVE